VIKLQNTKELIRVFRGSFDGFSSAVSVAGRFSLRVCRRDLAVALYQTLSEHSCQAPEEKVPASRIAVKNLV
jgi:hypothetical protein